MTKKESVWLIIRLAGVYFGYLMIISLFGVIALSPSVIFAPPDLKTAQKPTAEIPASEIQPIPYGVNQTFPNDSVQTKSGEAVSENVKNFLWYLFLSFIYGAVGFYLLRDGRLFYILLIKEDSIRTKESEPEVTTLNL